MRIRFTSLCIAACLLAACSTAPVLPPPPSAQSMVDAIRIAGQRSRTGLQVTPLRDASVQSLMERARQARTAGHYAQAAGLLDQALAKEPKAPDLLQERAEVAIYQHHFARAEALARASWAQGPRVGSLCVRNWQTVMEMRFVAHDDSGVAAARTRRDACPVKPVTRM